jgi:hypothetical protein
MKTVAIKVCGQLVQYVWIGNALVRLDELELYLLSPSSPREPITAQILSPILSLT